MCSLDEVEQRVDAVIQRLEADTRPAAAPLRRQVKDSSYGITIYRAEDETPESALFSVRRAVEVDINAPLAEVADAWWHQEERHLWDSTNMSNSRLLHEMDDKTRVWVYEVPERPYVASSSVSVIGREVPASRFRHTNDHSGGASRDARAFVQLFNDKYEHIQAPWDQSRFKSMMLLIADEPDKTRCIYVAELGAATAATPRESVVAIADNVAKVVHLLKQYLETGQYRELRAQRPSPA